MKHYYTNWTLKITLPITQDIGKYCYCYFFCGKKVTKKPPDSYRDENLAYRQAGITARFRNASGGTD